MEIFDDPYVKTPPEKSNRPGAKWVQNDLLPDIIEDAEKNLQDIKAKVGQAKMISVIYDRTLTVEVRAIYDEKELLRVLEYARDNVPYLTDFNHSKKYVKACCQVYHADHRDKTLFTPDDVKASIAYTKEKLSTLNIDNG